MKFKKEKNTSTQITQRSYRIVQKIETPIHYNLSITGILLINKGEVSHTKYYAICPTKIIQHTLLNFRKFLLMHLCLKYYFALVFSHVMFMFATIWVSFFLSQILLILVVDFYCNSAGRRRLVVIGDVSDATTSVLIG